MTSGMRRRARPELGGAGLYGSVVDAIGQDIVDGSRAAGELIQADQLCAEFAVSRSVVREALRTLGSMGLVEARPRVGTRVTPKARWDLLNPMVVYWRGSGADYLVQHRELLELRKGVEGVAAQLAAQRMPAAVSSTLLSYAVTMVAAVDNGDRLSFYSADAAFHRQLLESSGNAVIAKFADTVEALLRAKSADRRPAMAALDMGSARRHLDLAQALIQRDPEHAARVIGEIVDGSLAEFASAESAAAGNA